MNSWRMKVNGVWETAAEWLKAPDAGGTDAVVIDSNPARCDLVNFGSFVEWLKLSYISPQYHSLVDSQQR